MSMPKRTFSSPKRSLQAEVDPEQGTRPPDDGAPRRQVRDAQHAILGAPRVRPLGRRRHRAAQEASQVIVLLQNWPGLARALGAALRHTNIARIVIDELGDAASAAQERLNELAARLATKNGDASSACS